MKAELHNLVQQIEKKTKKVSGHMAIYYGNVFLFVGLTSLGTLIEEDVQTFQPLFCNLQKDNLLGILIDFRPLSYPFRSL